MPRKICGKITITGGKPQGTKLRVVAWDADIDDDDHMGIASVSDDGFYSIEFAGGDWDWSPLHLVATWRPDVYIMVEWLDPVTLQWRRVGKSRVYSNLEVRDDREIDLAVTLPLVNFCTVCGQVKNRQGKPLEGYTVTAWDEAPYAVARSRGRTGVEGPVPMSSGMPEKARFLGSAITDSDGEYRIQYARYPSQTPTSWSMFEGGVWWYPDIFIKVHKKIGSGVNYRSPTYQNVLPHTGVRINAVIEE